MESNKQTELIRKNKNRFIDGVKMTANWGRGEGLGGGGIEQKGKRTHGHGQQCGD